MLTGELLALLVVLGAAGGVVGCLAPTTALAVSVGAASLGVGIRPGWWRTGCWLLAAASAAAAHGGEARAAALGPPLARWMADTRPDGMGPYDPVLLSGVIAEDATRARAGGVRLVVDVTAVRGSATGSWVGAPGRVQLHVAGARAADGIDAWTRGRRLVVPAALRWPAYVRNPGSPTIEWQTLVRPFALLGTVKSAALIDVTPAGWFAERAADVRRAVRQRSLTLFPDTPQTAAIVVAILIGDRSDLDPEVEARLIDAGTYHVLAISGGNIAILTLAVVAVVQLITRSARWAAFVALLVVGAYGATVGGDPSVARAAVAAGIWLGTGIAGLTPRPLSLLATVAVIVTVIDPLMVVAPGAWLSFGATFGILMFAEPCARLLRHPSPSPPSAVTRWRNGVAGLIGATLAAEFVLLPVGAIVFQRITLAGPLLNLVAIPAMGIVQIGSIVALLLTSVSAPLAGLTGGLVEVAVGALVDSPALLAWAPWLAWRSASPSPIWAVVFYGTTASALMATPGTVRRRWCGRAALVAFGALCWWPRPAVEPMRPGWLRVTVLDVGQGESIVVQFPRGHVLLVDAGPATDTFDVGERVVTPALWALGVDRVDWAAFSHGDLDHAGGMAAVIDAFGAREVWEGVPVPPHPLRQRLTAEARRRGVPWRELRRGDRVTVDEVELEVLHPEVPAWERQRVRNDDSLVLRLRFGAAEMLLTGDVSASVERVLLPRVIGTDASYRVMKLGHHGSQSSTSDAWLDAYAPHIAIASLGRNNPFGHPSRDVVTRLASRGIPLIRTDRDGATTVETDGREVRVSTWTGRVWRTVERRQPRPA